MNILHLLLTAPPEAVFGLKHLISYCIHTKRCFGPTSRRRHSRGERDSLQTPSLTGRGVLLVRGLPLRVGGRLMRHGQKGVCVIACVCD